MAKFWDNKYEFTEIDEREGIKKKVLEKLKKRQYQIVTGSQRTACLPTSTNNIKIKHVFKALCWS